MPISTRPALPIAATFFGTIAFSFGLNYVFRPRAAFATFEFPSPSTPTDQNAMDAMMVLCGAKELFMGVAICVSTWYGTRKSAGLILMAASGSALIDGVVVKSMTGGGERDHWGYGSVKGALGVALAGLLG